MVILREYRDVARFVDIARKHADANRAAFGFLNENSYDDSAGKGNLWVAVTEEPRAYLGHLIVGGTRNVGKVFQVCACEDHRGEGVARGLIEAFVGECEKMGRLEVAAKVAVDLPANGFYLHMGFSIRRQIDRGRGRLLNLMVRPLATPSLLGRLFAKDELDDKEAVQIPAIPKLTIPLVAIDVNVYLDVLHDRLPEEGSGDLIAAALAHQFKLAACRELSEELLRNHPKKQADPTLAFARKLPVLEAPGKQILDSLTEDLRKLVFPDRDTNGKRAHRDLSDLIHLATAVHNHAHVFVTRERAMLRASDDIERRFALRVCFPAEFLDEYCSSGPVSRDSLLTTRSSGEVVRVAPLLPVETETVKEFCHSSGVDTYLLEELISGVRNRSSRMSVFTAKANDRLVAVYGAGIDHVTMRAQAVAVVSDDAAEPQRLIDHCLSTVLQSVPERRFYVIQLHLGSVQSGLAEAALAIGFQPAEGEAGHRILVKPVFSGLLTKELWPVVRDGFAVALGLSLPETMPTYHEFCHTGLAVTGNSGLRGFLRLGKFEDLLSPSLLVPSGRGGVVVPIQSRFADSLFGAVAGTQDLFTDSEALTRLERAYFRAPTRLKMLPPGQLILFHCHPTSP